MEAKGHADYLQQEYLPTFIPNVYRDFYAIVWSVDDKVIAVTQKFAQACGFAYWEDMLGLVLGAQSKLNFPLLKKFPADAIACLNEIFVAAAKLRAKVIHRRHPVVSIIIHPLSNLFDSALILHHFPIYHPNGEVIAVRTDVNRFDAIFSFKELLCCRNSADLEAPSNIIHSNKLPLPLTNRQHEVVFLLAHGMTQNEVAKILKISRGSVARICTALSAKFALEQHSAITLVEAAREKNLHRYIPSSLCRLWVIELDNS